MKPVIDIFGKSVDRLTDVNPLWGRKLFALGIRAEKLRLDTIRNKGMLPFRSKIPSLTSDLVIKTMKTNTKKAMVSIFVPCEIINSMGIIPYSVECLSGFITGVRSYPGFLEACDNAGFPETLCSYHRAYIGADLRGFMPIPKSIIYTNLACDANQITFKYLAEKNNIPSFYIDVPYVQNEEAVEYVKDQIKKMPQFLEDVYHIKFSEDRFKLAMIYSKEAIENYRKYLLMQKDKLAKGNLTGEMYILMNNHMLLGTKKLADVYKRAVNDMKLAPKARGKKLLWIHIIPFWQNSVCKLLNNNDEVHVVASDMAYENMRPVNVDEPYRTLAERMVYSPFNSNGESRINAALDFANKIKVDGIVYYAHWGCKNTLGLAKIAKKEFEKAGYPTLILDGDGCDPRNTSNGQVATRLEAFLEMLKA